MNVKSLFTAVVAAVTLPLAASAAMFTGNVSPGGAYEISDGPFEFNAGFDQTDVAGAYTFTFMNTLGSKAFLSLAISTINQFSDGEGGFPDYFFRDGVTTSFGSASHVTAGGVSDTFRLGQTIEAGSSVQLAFAFGDPVAAGVVGPDIDFRVVATPVPVPAAGLMMAGALGGFGWLARRRRAAA